MLYVFVEAIVYSRSLCRVTVDEWISVHRAYMLACVRDQGVYVYVCVDVFLSAPVWLCRRFVCVQCEIEIVDTKTLVKECQRYMEKKPNVFHKIARGTVWAGGEFAHPHESTSFPVLATPVHLGILAYVVVSLRVCSESLSCSLSLCMCVWVCLCVCRCVLCSVLREYQMVRTLRHPGSQDSNTTCVLPVSSFKYLRKVVGKFLPLKVVASSGKSAHSWKTLRAFSLLFLYFSVMSV